MQDLFSVEVFALWDIQPGEEITISCKLRTYLPYFTSMPLYLTLI